MYTSGSSACSTFRNPSSAAGPVHWMASRPFGGSWEGDSTPAEISTTSPSFNSTAWEYVPENSSRSLIPGGAAMTSEEITLTANSSGAHRQKQPFFDIAWFLHCLHLRTLWRPCQAESHYSPQLARRKPPREQFLTVGTWIDGKQISRAE